MNDQQKVMEDVKKLLKDIDHFFSVTLKKEKLKKDSLTEKDKLNGQVKELLAKLVGEEPQEEYDEASSYLHEPQEEDDSGMMYEETVVDTPQKPLPSMDNLSHTGSQKSSENDEDNDEGEVNYEGAKMRPKSVSELTQCLKEGMLDKKRKEGQFGFSAWQTRYCIIKDNIMYYFKSKTDSKQCNEINLSGYEAVSSPDIEKKHKRRQFLFVISQPGCRSFQFIAQSQEDMKSWIDAVNTASKITPKPPEPALTSGGDNTSVASADDFGDEYEDLSDYQRFKLEQSKTGDNQPKSETIAEEDDFGDEYEDLSDYQKFKASQKPPEPVPRPRDVPSFDANQGEDDFGDEYEDLDEYQKFKLAEAKKPNPAPAADFGETYDDVSVLPPPPADHLSVKNTPLPPPPMEMLKRDLPQPPPRDLPAPPTEETKTNSSVTSGEPWANDFKNIYMGKWDCRPDEENELEFKRGDLIHILSQEFDGWWIGEKNYQVGLVPRDYLMQAYICT